jgi:hypothetical protein
LQANANNLSEDAVIVNQVFGPEAAGQKDLNLLQRYELEPTGRPTLSKVRADRPAIGSRLDRNFDRQPVAIRATSLTVGKPLVAFDTIEDRLELALETKKCGNSIVADRHS